MAVLRLNLRDEWTVSEFTETLAAVNESYERSVRLLAISKRFESQAFEQTLLASLSREPRRFWWSDAEEILYQGDMFEFRRLARQNPLQLGEVHLSSPGIVELLGQWNP